MGAGHRVLKYFASPLLIEVLKASAIAAGPNCVFPELTSISMTALLLPLYLII